MLYNISKIQKNFFFFQRLFNLSRLVNIALYNPLPANPGYLINVEKMLFVANLEITIEQSPVKECTFIVSN